MVGPGSWGIAGNPISHSPTPRMFSIVGEYMGMEAHQIYVESNSIEDFVEKTSRIKGDIWVSCTSPLKHAAPSGLGVKSPRGVDAVNQLMRSGGSWSGTNTDGMGFVSACRHIGVDPSIATLRIRGGGSAARSIAASWSSAGGSIISEKGRRPLNNGPWSGKILESGHADLAVDLDAPPAGGESADLDGDIQVSISYGEDASADDFAVIMLAAQHLHAWESLFAPLRGHYLPSLTEFLSRL
ncbi:MAG: hypothetical protein QF736_01770 [Candidatus Thalassarchaeaceae archaeon]|nr:hypothetical protein [Candidatus Thalassarchaeaceae archaeon]